MDRLDFIIKANSRDSEFSYAEMSSLDINVKDNQAISLYPSVDIELFNYNLISDGSSVGSFFQTSPDSEIDFYTGRNTRSTNQTVYTITHPNSGATDGLVITSSAGSYSSNGNYHMEYLFNGITDSTSASTYWLTNSSGNQTLTFDFSSTSIDKIKKIRVVPYTRSDARSNYWLEKSTDNSTWVSINDSDGTAIGTSASPFDTSSFVLGDKVTHFTDGVAGTDVTTYPYIRFNLTRQGNYGVTLHEIEMVSTSGVVVGGSSTESITFNSSFDSEKAPYIAEEKIIFMSVGDESIRYQEDFITAPGSGGGSADPESWG